MHAGTPKFCFEFLHWCRELEAVRQEQAAPLVEENAQLRARIEKLEAAARLQQGELEAARREASELREQGAQADQMVANLQRCAMMLHMSELSTWKAFAKAGFGPAQGELQCAMQLG